MIDYAAQGDCISIRGIEADCIIGINEVERRELQRVRLDLDLFCDLSRAGASDDIADTLDYKTLRDRVVELLAASRDGLIERLAQRVAAVCLSFPQVNSVTLRLAKPGALTGACDVAVVVARDRRHRPVTPEAGTENSGA